MSAEYRFYISPSVEGVVVVSINHRDTYIVNNTVFEAILRGDSIYGIPLIVRSLQRTIPNEFLTAYKHRSVC